MLLFSLFFAGQLACAQNQVLVLSGGGGPQNNHYSQYLQTKAVYDDLSARLPYAVDLFFAAGNRPETVATYADVHKTAKYSGIGISSFLVGRISKNNPATKSNIEKYFQSLHGVPLQNFFMLVSDHGMPNKVGEQFDETHTNNCIDMWNVTQKDKELHPIGDFAQSRCLSKNELKTLIETNVAAQNKVFAMSQCFSGGFHQMSVDESRSGPSAGPTARPDICGFSAVTHDTFASGCSPDVDGPSYQGYERSFTEELTGFDYINNKYLHPPSLSFKEAHAAAMQTDLTFDIPLATSDYFLWRWSLKMLSAGTSTAFVAAADFRLDLKDTDFTDKQDLFKRMQNILQTQFPEMASELELSFPKLNELVKALGKQTADERDRIETLENDNDKVFEKTIHAFWKKALPNIGNQILSNAELEVENQIQKFELKHPGGGADDYYITLLPILWSEPSNKAQLTSYYLKGRNERIARYVLEKGDPEISKAADQYIKTEKLIAEMTTRNQLDLKHHGLLRRMLIYRSVLGAWAQLQEVSDQVALRDLKGLLQCEATPL